MRKTAMITATVLFGASMLAGCGSDDKGSDDKGSNAAAGGDYCDTLKSMADDITSFTGSGTPDFELFDEFLDNAKELADKAPDAVAEDWDTLLGAMDELTAALKDAGVSLEEMMQAASTGKLPAGVTVAEAQALGTKLQSLSGAEVSDATKAIDKHAKDECGVSLSQS